jgi:Na+-transporting NADH:ubiquinone oxidoreductase subunit C
MASANPVHWWRRFRDAPNDGAGKTLAVALMVALVSAVVVSATAVSLKPLQVANLERERQARMAEMVARLPGMESMLAEAGVDSLEARIVDLATGTLTGDLDPATFDQRAAAADPETSTELADEVDIAGLGRRANHAPVFLVRRGDALALIVLPVSGAGYESTLYGYLALDGDANTVAGLTFYEQGETPGLGARIQDPAWQALWPGKQIADEDGEIRISVVRGQASGPFEVDGISGATRTSTGVSNLLRFWLGENGFGPFLRRIREGEILR